MFNLFFYIVLGGNFYFYYVFVIINLGIGEVYFSVDNENILVD